MPLLLPISNKDDSLVNSVAESILADLSDKTDEKSPEKEIEQIEAIDTANWKTNTSQFKLLAPQERLDSSSFSRRVSSLTLIKPSDQLLTIKSNGAISDLSSLINGTLPKPKSILPYDFSDSKKRKLESPASLGTVEN